MTVGNRLRLILAAAFVGLIAWMAVDESAFDRKSAKIRAALDAAAIGFQSDEEGIKPARVRGLIQNLMSGQSPAIDYAINEPPKSDRLDIYFTSPAAKDATGVDFGNAAYDPVLDAIYIDKSFVDHSVYLNLCRGSGFGALGCKDYFPTLDILFAFVFMHELGHRQLHGVGSGFLAFRNSSSNMREYEQQADQFALDRLKESYATGFRIVSDSDDSSITDAISLSISERGTLDPSSHVWIDMVGSLVTTTMLNGFLSGPYSPFYTDPAHPSFVERSAGLIGAVLKDNELPAGLRVHFQFFQAFLQRQAEAPKSLVREVVFPEPLVNVGFTSSSLLATTDRGRRIADIALVNLTPESKSTSAPVHVPSLQSGPYPNEKTKLTWPSGWVIAKSDVFWPILDENEHLLVVDADVDKTWNYRKGSWQQVDKFPIKTNQCFDSWTGPQPSTHAFARNCPSNSETMLYGLKKGVVVSRRSQADLVAELKSTLSEKSIELPLLKSNDRAPVVFVNGDLVAFDVRATDAKTGNEYHLAVAVLDLNTLEISKVIDLLPARDMLELSDRKQVLARPTRDNNEISADVFLVSQLTEEDKDTWGVWRMTPNRKFELLAKSDYLLASELGKLGSGLMDDFEPKFILGSFFGNGKLLINYEGDSAYTVDLKSGEVDVLFAFGGITHSFAVSSYGHVALFLRGAGKLYVFKP